jgi:hypothetical protein
MGVRYTFPAGIWNSVMSVSHSSFWALALKSRLIKFWRRTDLSKVKPALPFLVGSNDQTLLLHQTLHHLLRQVELTSAQRRMHAPVPISFGGLIARLLH